MSLFKNMNQGDKVTRRRADVQLKSRDTLAKLNESIQDEFNPDKKLKEATTVFIESQAGGLTRRATAKRQNSLLREENRQKVYSRISEDLTEIVIKGLSIDEEEIERNKGLLTENIQNIFIEFFNENLISPRMLIENKSSIVRNLARHSILQEELDDDEKSQLILDAGKIADTIKAKTDEIIKDEVKNAKKKKETEDSLKGISKDDEDDESTSDDEETDTDEDDDSADDDMDGMDDDDAGDDDDDSMDDDSDDEESDDDDSSDDDEDSEDDTEEEEDTEVEDDKKKKKKKGLMESTSLGIHRTIRDTRKGTFTRFLRESAKEYAKLTGNLNVEVALADASIKYSILECLNTMNLVTSVNKQNLIDKLNGKTSS